MPVLLSSGKATSRADPGWFFCFGFFLCPFCFSYRYDRLSCVGRLSVSPELAALTCWNVYAFMNQVSRTTNRKRKTPTASPAARSSLSLLLLLSAAFRFRFLQLVPAHVRPHRLCRLRLSKRTLPSRAGIFVYARNRNSTDATPILSISATDTTVLASMINRL